MVVGFVNTDGIVPGDIVGVVFIWSEGVVYQVEAIFFYYNSCESVGVSFIFRESGEFGCVKVIVFVVGKKFGVEMLSLVGLARGFLFECVGH